MNTRRQKLGAQGNRARRRGVAIVYASVFMVALIAITSLAVDWGRVQTAKTELQDATDAAARYAVSGLSDSTSLAKAQAVALQNRVDGSTLALTAADVDVGTWDSTTRTFAIGGSNVNAVRVTGRRTTARGNAVPLLFAKAIGRQTCDVTAVSIASQDITPYSVVALSGITMSASSTIKRTAAEAGSGTVVVASNGSWSLTGSCSIVGDALYRTSAPNNKVTGTKTAMSTNIAYPAVSTPGGTTNYGAINYTSGNYPVGGNYAVTACTISGTFTITLTADTNMYCSGNASFGGNTQIITNGYKMTIYMTGSGTIAFTNNLPINVVIYGPNSAMTVNAPGKITGSFVANTVNMSAGTIEYTAALPIPIAPTAGGAAQANSGVLTVK